MFNSIDHRNVPWRAGQKIELWPSRYDGTPASMVARPNFQHNPTNGVLHLFRAQRFPELPLGAHIQGFLNGINRLVSEGFSTAEIEHARKVLTRIRRLEQKAALEELLAADFGGE